MARTKGTANLAASLEVLAGAPLDSRTVVPTVADLTVAANFPYKYIGMPVVVQATGDMYVLTANDVTVSANWKKVNGSSGSGGHTVKDNGTAMTARSGLNFTDFDISDDSTNDETDVKAHRLTQEEMADIIYKTPNLDLSQQSVEANIYSTTEKVIGQWTDGKLLYQKTVYVSALPSSEGEIELNTGITNLDKVWKYWGIGIFASGNTFMFPYLSHGSQSSIEYNYIANNYIKIDGAKMMIQVGRDRSSVSAYITLQYTKTTDSPLAAGEKYAGVDVDGSVIYKKTYTTNTEWTIYANSFTDTDISATNVEKCIDCKGYDNNGSSITGFLVNTYGKGSRYTSFNVCGYRANNAAIGIKRFDFYYTKKTS